MKMVWIKWRDSNRYLNQHSVEDAKGFKVEILETVGHLVFEDSDKVVVAGDWLTMSGDVRHVMAIPVENVVERKFIAVQEDVQ